VTIVSATRIGWLQAKRALPYYPTTDERDDPPCDIATWSREAGDEPRLKAMGWQVMMLPRG
jgi:hypothetical protein